MMSNYNAIYPLDNHLAKLRDIEKRNKVYVTIGIFESDRTEEGGEKIRK